jgi:hypothetical protein
LLTALSATTAKAIVIDTDGSVVLGSSGPHASTMSAKPEMMKPLIAQRTVWARVAILDPGPRSPSSTAPIDRDRREPTSDRSPHRWVSITSASARWSCRTDRASPPSWRWTTARGPLPMRSCGLTLGLQPAGGWCSPSSADNMRSCNDRD